jgi:hypothetical protein
MVSEMTNDEHGRLLHVTSLLLLGYLLPHSTGNEWVLLQNASRSIDPNDSPRQRFLQLSLLERFDKLLPYYAGIERGSLDDDTCLTDTHLDLALYTLLHQGIAPLLLSRPFHRTNVDLLHVLACAIHPLPVSGTVLANTHKYLNQMDRPAYHRTQLIMEHPCSIHFQIRYGIRRLLVRLVGQSLLLPPMPDDVTFEVVGPLLHGSIPHLRASLRAFANRAQSLQDRHDAWKTLVSIAIQTSNEHILLDEWDYQLHCMLDDKDEYGCCKYCHTSYRCKGMEQNSYKASVDIKENNSFCPHFARGKLLSNFILWSAEECTQEIGLTLRRHALASITNAVEWQVDCWTVKDRSNADVSRLHSTCLVASLEMIATQCALTLTPQLLTTQDHDHIETLLQSGIQFLRHSDRKIVYQATELLATALTLINRNEVSEYAWLIFVTIKDRIESDVDGLSVFETLIGSTARRSSRFAVSLYQYLLERCEKGIGLDIGSRWIAALAFHAPFLVAKTHGRLESLLITQENDTFCLHFTAALIMRRQMHYFQADSDPTVLVRSRVLSARSNLYGLFILAGHALATGNFEIALKIYERLLPCISTMHFYLWITALFEISEAESILARHASKAMPAATCSLQKAMSSLGSMKVFRKGTKPVKYDCTFHIEYIRLRIDLLDLLIILRQLVSEMRLTGAGPMKNTRNYLHLKNVIRCFGALGARYRHLEEKYTEAFRRDQTHQCFVVYRMLCMFFVVLTRVGFNETSTDSTGLDRMENFPISDAIGKWPLPSMIKELTKLMVQPMAVSSDSFTAQHAGEMLEAIDGILLAPFPYPRDFLSPFSI